MTLVLREYERQVLPLTHDEARRLVAATEGRLTVSPAPAGGYVVGAREYVGAVAVSDLRILVRPKVPMDNVFLMLGSGMPRDSWRSEQYDFATSPDLLASFAAFFGRTCTETLRAGVIRKYRTMSERLLTIRGRIDLAAQLRRPGLESPVACAFDEYTDDVTENRVVKAALARLLRVAGIGNDVRRALRRELARLADVSADVPDLALVERLHYDRLNAHYRPLVALSVLVLRNVTLRDSPGGATASAFLVDMNDLFQTFVTDRLRASLAGRLEVDAEPVVHLGMRRAVPMQPDLVLRRGGTPVYVGDAKYKLVASARGYAPDYYQLLAYTTAMDLPEGVLVYCTTDEDAPPGLVEVRHGGKRLYAWRLRLDGSRAEVETAVARLADWIAERAAARSAA